jgi:DegV family protein with EDD domain
MILFLQAGSMNKRNIAIIADSTCDIPQDLISKYGIGVVSHYVIWNGREYRDRVDMQPDEFYTLLKTQKTRPTTSQASEMDFLQAYKVAEEKGALQIVALTVSSALSGAHQMALNAARAMNIPVNVVDSKGPSFSLGWQTLAAARLAEAGENTQTILRRVDEIRQSLVMIVGMNTLEYLKAGGRIGGAGVWLGAHLQVKPVVSINHMTGLVEPEGIARTYSSMVDLVVRKFKEKLKGRKPEHIAILHGNTPEEAETLVKRVQVEFSPAEILMNITGPALGVNSGPGAVALCGY